VHLNDKISYPNRGEKIWENWGGGGGRLFAPKMSTGSRLAKILFGAACNLEKFPSPWRKNYAPMQVNAGKSIWKTYHQTSETSSLAHFCNFAFQTKETKNRLLVQEKI
jgi:hypothetical protein